MGYYRAFSVEGVASLKPDTVLASDQSGPPQAPEQLQRLGSKVVVVPSAPTLAALDQRILGVAAALGVEARGSALVGRIHAALRDIRPVPAPLRVLLVSSHTGKLEAAGDDTAAAAMLRLVGATNVLPAQSGYKPFSAEAAVALRPDVIVTTTLSVQASGSLDAFLAQPGLSATPAAKARRVVVMDDLLLLGFGPRLPEALRQLEAGLAAEVLTALKPALRRPYLAGSTRERSPPLAAAPAVAPVATARPRRPVRTAGRGRHLRRRQRRAGHSAQPVLPLLFDPAAAGEAAMWRSVLLEVRLPRIVLALTVGAGLALSGAVMQALFRNPLAEPGLIGISPGGAMGAVAAIVLGAQGTAGIAPAAFAGSPPPRPGLPPRQPASRRGQPAAGRGRHQRDLCQRGGLLHLPGQRGAAARPDLLEPGQRPARAGRSWPGWCRWWPCCARC